MGEARLTIATSGPLYDSWQLQQIIQEWFQNNIQGKSEDFVITVEARQVDKVVSS